MIIGQSDFKIQKEKGYYIDKTLFIEELLERLNTSTGFIINRPRRFGKSLMLSMIDYFFNEKYDSKVLFKDLEISKTKAIEYLNKFPVIKLSFKNPANNYEGDVVSQLKENISSLYRDFKNDIYNQLNEQNRNKFDLFCSNCLDVNFSDSLSFLIKSIYKVKKEKPIILIDEYDAPIEKAFGTNEFENVSSFLKSLFVNAFKDSTDFNFLIMTGVFSISKGTLASGLNNIPIDNGLTKVLKRNYFGFTNEDMHKIKEKYFLSDDEVNKLYEYYGGYNFFGEEVFNPWSILNYLNTRSFDDYWTGSASNDTFGKIVSKSKISYEEEFIKILSEGKIVNLNSSVSYETIDDSFENVIFYFILAGYLRAEKIDLGLYFVDCPNIETRFAITNEIKKNYKDQNGISKLVELKLAFKNGDAEKIKNLITTYILSSLSYYDFANEKNYQIMIGTLVSLLFSECRVKFEVISGTGRCDIMVSPKSPKSFGAVIEIKYNKTRLSTTRLKESSEAALKQIIDNEYTNELLSTDSKPVYAFGFAFMKNKVEVASKKIRD